MSNSKESTGKPLGPIEKSLLDMPVHVVERIFQLSEMPDKKTLSETCKSLNNIFSGCRILSKIWINMNKLEKSLKHAIVTSERKYTNLISNIVLPVCIWNHLSSDLTSLIVEIRNDEKNFDDSIIDALPHFANLIHLDINVRGKVYRRLQPKQRKTVAEPVTMKKLQYLRFSRVFMALYYDRYIKFETSKLHTIIFIDNYSAENLISTEDWIAKTRDLIQKQDNLKVLHLHVFNQFFDHRLNVKGQLRELNIYQINRGIPAYQLMPLQQENLCEFVLSQRELKAFNIRIDSHNGLGFQRLKCIQQSRLSMKVKYMEIICTSADGQQKDVRAVNVNQLQLSEPNFAVEELDLSFHDYFQLSPFSLRNLYAEIASQFPNLSIVTISSHDAINFPLVHTLGSIKKFTYRRVQNDNRLLLESNTIPNLEEFGLMCLQAWELKMMKDDFMNFLIRHKTIKRIEILFYTDPYRSLEDESLLAELMSEIIVTASEHLDNIKLISVKTSVPNWEKKQHYHESYFINRRMCSLIEEHAHPGFVYRSLDFEVLKRYDGEVVSKQFGRWIAV